MSDVSVNTLELEEETFITLPILQLNAWRLREVK